jgi:hypothetical protein
MIRYLLFKDKMTNLRRTIFLLLMFVSLTTPQAQTTYETVTFPDGSKYVGEVKNDKKHGQGTLTLPDGSKYVGEWKNGLPNGQGALTFPEGKYVGEWKNGEHHGQGTLTLPDGRVLSGLWKNNKFIE